jgi:DNA-binding response OmpR family regulator
MLHEVQHCGTLYNRILGKAGKSVGVAEVASSGALGSQETRSPIVLMVDDDPQLRVMLGYALRQESFEVQEASSGEAALEMLKHQEPDIILMDLLMPGMGGVEACRRIRDRSSVPVIILTALGRDEDIVSGLDAGADDYCTKPVSLVQLVARIRAQLRRREMDAATSVRTLSVDEGNLVVDSAARQAIVKGRAIDLSPREFELLHRLAQSPGRVVSHEELLEHVWGTTSPEYLAHLRSYIKLLRQKIEPDPHHPQYIRSRARMGYILADRPQDAESDGSDEV